MANRSCRIFSIPCAATFSRWRRRLRPWKRKKLTHFGVKFTQAGHERLKSGRAGLFMGGDLRVNDPQQNHDDHSQDGNPQPEIGLALLRFLENSLLVSKPGARPPLSSSLRLTPWGGRRLPFGRRRRCLQLQFHIAQPQGLAGFQDAFGDFFAVDEGAVRRIEILDENFVAAQMDFAMMAGNGSLGDLKQCCPQHGQSWCDPRSARVRGRSSPGVRITSLAMDLR